jgi:hypothetical protein
VKVSDATGLLLGVGSDPRVRKLLQLALASVAGEEIRGPPSVRRRVERIVRKRA